MAAFRNKQTRIKLLCDRAEKEDIYREELASRGLSRQEIDKEVLNSRMEKYRTNSVNTPWNESTRVLPILNATNIGLPNTHLAKTSTQAMYAPIQKKLEKVKMQSQGFKLEPLEPGLTQKPRAQTTDFDQIRKTQKNLNQKEHDKFIKEQNFRDHLNEMYKGMDSLYRPPTSSHYSEQFEFTKNMQDLCDNVNFDHHLLKNDLKWFTEAYVKYKGTMRK